MIAARSGFSLVELLVVLAIMAVLATIALPLAELNRQRENEALLRTSLRDIRSALDAYKRAVDEGRVESAPGSSGYPPSLDILVQGVPDRRSPTGQRIYFLRRLPADPFFEGPAPPAPDGTPIGTDAAATWGLRAYASSPQQPQAGSDVFDVYSLSRRLATDGRRYSDW